MSRPFRDIDFGRADAHHEAEDNRDLLLGGFFDLHQALERCLDGPEFLVLGYKGSGKSALGQHIELAGDELGARARVIKLQQLPFLRFVDLAEDDDGWQTAYPTIWSWFLLLDLFDAFLLPDEPDEELQKIVALLRGFGALPATDLPAALRGLRHVPAALDDRTATEPLPAMHGLVDALVVEMSRFASRSRQILVLDGLDEVLEPGQNELRVLAALLASANRLNSNFKRQGVPAKIIVLCRTDLFDRLPGANTNKYGEDRAVELVWTRVEKERSALLHLATLKARVTDPLIEDLFEEYFPERTERQPTVDYLLDHTRHTPRDFLRVLKRIQECVGPEQMRVGHSDIRSGLKEYSGYFDREIRNELSGIAADEEVEALVQLLIRNGRRTFTVAELKELGGGAIANLEPLLRRLFDCGAIGNVERRDSGAPKFTFKYRNPNAAMNAAAPLRVHMGWQRKLNLLEQRDAPGPANVAPPGRRPRHRMRGGGSAKTPSSATDAGGSAPGTAVALPVATPNAPAAEDRRTPPPAAPPTSRKSAGSSMGPRRAGRPAGPPRIKD